MLLSQCLSLSLLSDFVKGRRMNGTTIAPNTASTGGKSSRGQGQGQPNAVATTDLASQGHPENSSITNHNDSGEFDCGSVSPDRNANNTTVADVIESRITQPTGQDHHTVGQGQTGNSREGLSADHRRIGGQGHNHGSPHVSGNGQTNSKRTSKPYRFVDANTDEYDQMVSINIQQYKKKSIFGNFIAKLNW